MRMSNGSFLCEKKKKNLDHSTSKEQNMMKGLKGFREVSVPEGQTLSTIENECFIMKRKQTIEHLESCILQERSSRKSATGSTLGSLVIK